MQNKLNFFLKTIENYTGNSYDLIVLYGPRFSPKTLPAGKDDGFLKKALMFSS